MTNNKTDTKVFPPKVPNNVLAKNDAKIAR
jgi:hypothetical protein